MQDPKPEKRVRNPDLLRKFRLEHLNDPCEICGLEVGTEIHHRTFRSQGGGDVEENLLWIGRRCHNDIHSGRLDRYDFVQ